VDFLGPDAFAATSDPPRLADDEIHLWFFPQWKKNDGGTTNSPLVRNLLARYLDAPADSFQIEHTASGKPFLVGGRLQFNVSHSGSALLLGVSRDQPLGVDIETSGRPRRAIELAERFFAASETAALRAMPPALVQRAFLNLWSCKEAILKAHGTGISFGLHRVVFELNGAGEVCRLAQIDPDAGAAGQWHWLRLAPLPECSGALAWRGVHQHVRAFTAARE
jgi:4'-phosphopantetheinyl transferase